MRSDGPCTAPWAFGLTRYTEKTAKQTTDIILYDQKVIVFKMESDVMLYVVGSAEENEVLLYRYRHVWHAEEWAYS